jgi:DNA-binding response OmpR family regulator
MKKRILIADDDTAIIDALQVMFELEGYEVEISLDGETFYKAKQRQPDVILLDIWLSGRDGRDICRFLKKNKLTKHIPTLMISASSGVEKSAIAAGADDFISKPFEMDLLLDKVKRATEKDL